MIYIVPISSRLWIISCCFIVCCWACSNENILITPSEGAPVKVVAQIAAASRTKAEAAADNSYERSTFIAGDKIRIVKTHGEKTQQDYAYSGLGTWDVATSGASPITLQAAATYQATYPADYSAIRQDQSLISGYLQSNKLQSKPITSRTEVLNFIFNHANTKLTLAFDLIHQYASQSLPAKIVIEGTGLYTGGTLAENVTLFRPESGTSTWCGIVYPKGGNTEIRVSLVYAGVTYRAKLACPMAAGTHYTYTLTIQNDILVPIGGGTIKDWNDFTVYTGVLQ